MSTTALALVASLFALVAVIAYGAYLNVLRSLRGVRRAVRCAAEGSQLGAIPIPSESEVAPLAKDLNELLSAARSTREAIEETNRNLEVIVEARTSPAGSGDARTGR